MGTITKQRFCEIINEIRDAQDAAMSIRKQMLGTPAFKDTMDFFDPACLIIGNTSVVLELLAKMFDDESGWIEYFCFELNYGRDWTPNMITDKNGEDIRLDSAERLYDMLVWNR